MDENLSVAVSNEIIEEIEKSKKLEVGTDAHKQAIETVGVLLDKAIDMGKIDTDIEKANVANEGKAMEMEIERKDRIIKNILNGLGTVGGFCLTAWGTIYLTKYEDDHIIDKTALKSFANKLFKNKK